MSRSTPLQIRRRLPNEAAVPEGAPSTEIVEWAVERHGDGLVVLASFGDLVLVDVVMSVCPDVPVVFLDTGFHFAETLETARRAQVRYGLDLRVVRPDPEAIDLFAAGTAECCAARKVEPMDRALAGRTAWISGLRRSDHPGRGSVPIIDADRRGLEKINPIADWDDATVDRYVEERGLIVHPLSVQGYESIGCWPCTEPGAGRSGRWAGEARAECGIHS
ncbi:MAG: phosphoadenylyl-sulfate reductase [Actinomycetota bacterium]